MNKTLYDRAARPIPSQTMSSTDPQEKTAKEKYKYGNRETKTMG